MKKFLTFLLFLLTFNLFAQERFRIKETIYESNGITREYALKQIVKIDYTRIFENYDELNKYLTDIRQQFNNERNFSSVLITTSYDFETEDDQITGVILRVLTEDSNHLLAVPYPKYNSNDGFIFKLKMKDTNFLGTLNTLNFDLNFAAETNSENSDIDYKLGLNAAYDYPFALGPFDATWNNSYSISMTIGEKRPEFNARTGISLVKPFDFLDLRFDLNQSAIQDFDYEIYGDELYYKTDVKFSVPLKIAEIEDFSKVTLSPYLQMEANWKTEYINEENDDLSSPIIKAGASIDAGRVNWFGNLRNGFTFDINHYAGYNFQRQEYVTNITAEAAGFKAFKRFGINSRLYAFGSINTKKNTGSYIRGIMDDQKVNKIYWENSTKNSRKFKALYVTSALILNVDIPVSIVTTDWNGWTNSIFGEESWITKHTRWFRYFDFELQLSPFADIALTSNEYTERNFSFHDGWYGTGIEILIFPAKWRSLVVRASLGLDAGQVLIPKISDSFYDTSWRSKESKKELSIGIGLHY